mgnify:CR=1 FL=1
MTKKIIEFTDSYTNFSGRAHIDKKQFKEVIGSELSVLSNEKGLSKNKDRVFII